MHEMSIAAEVLETVLAVAADNGADRVDEVQLSAGAMKLIVPEALDMAWQAVTEGTPAEGSRLVLTEVPIAARCNVCGRLFQPAIDNYLCPSCGQADVEITAGDDIILTSITCCRSEGTPAE
ncbi:MAG: hydrogenase maturation nickel metallochaperone HypA [Planctomycetes bacterium]|nr:hydrogenase maturation nickel metallochaperone HypA [Planctomycetota bacterium]